MRADRLLRGGSWFSDPRDCRSALRGLNRPNYAGSGIGFRVVCKLPKTSKTIDRKLLRGGSWNDLPGNCRSAHRYHFWPVNAIYDVGFRVVCRLPKIPKMFNYKLVRGGSRGSSPRDCRSANRSHDQPDYAYYFVGFRVVCLPQITQQSNPESMASHFTSLPPFNLFVDPGDPDKRGPTTDRVVRHTFNLHEHDIEAMALHAIRKYLPDGTDGVLTCKDGRWKLVILEPACYNQKQGQTAPNNAEDS